MKKLISRCHAAAGKEKAEYVLKNANVVNVFTETIEIQDIAITDGYIVGLGNYCGEIEMDMSGKYVSPGFIDAHMHIESSMVLPEELAKYVLKSGTTTLIADPHELVNVSGSKAIDWLLKATENTSVDYYIMLPSAVPATKYETNGSTFTSADVEKYIDHPRILGLGEVMCFDEVIDCDPEIIRKLSLCHRKIADGHAPNLTGKRLQTYVCAGIKTEHECTTFDEAYEKARAGLTILIREGSGAKNLEAIVSGIISNKVPTENFLFCTDDKHLEDIEIEGHIRWNVKKAVDLGLNPIAAIKMASYYTAKTYGLNNTGAVAAGYKADLIIFDNLTDLNVLQVYKRGKIVTEQSFENHIAVSVDECLLSTVFFDDITEDQIQLAVEDKNNVIEIVPNQILTKRLFQPIPSRNGYFSPNHEYSKLCVIERHKKTGTIAVAPLKGFNIYNAAIATSVAHDSHNVIVAGDNDRDIVLAVNRLKEIQGGYVIFSGGRIISEQQLSICGLLSTKPAHKVQENIRHMIAAARSLGIHPDIDPFITLSFLALPVLPEIRLTNLGLFDSRHMCFYHSSQN